MDIRLTDVLLWLLFAVPALCLFLVAVWYFRPGVSRRWLPPVEEENAVNWTGLELLVVLLLCFAFLPAVGGYLLDASNLLTWLYGWQPKENLAGLLMSAAPDAAFPGNLPWGPLILANERGALEKARWDLWMGALIYPLDLIAVPMLLYLTRQTLPRDLGITARHFFRNLLAGGLAWFLITPLVYAIQLAIQPWIHGPPETHSLEKVARDHPLAIELVLIPFVALIAAPVGEELVFRGVLQQWLARRPSGGMILVIGSLFWVLAQRAGPITQGWREQQLIGALGASAPVLFVLLLLPIFAVLHYYGRSSTVDAIFGTALFFAVGHGTWPHPIPLFVLGLGLGYLFHRTQSLVAPVTTHLLFNSVACIELLSG